MELITLIVIVLLFSIIQSIFGIGLLLFGTPTLLILGYPYDVTLWMILPSSIAISLIQTTSNYPLVQYKRSVVFYTLPSLIISLAFVLNYESEFDIKNIVGGVLIGIGLVKLVGYFDRVLITIIKTHINSYYVVMGIVHGVSNMGGGQLSVLMSALYKDKYAIRANIAFVYMLFGITQLIVLTAISLEDFQINGILLMFVSVATYLYANSRLVPQIKEEKYQFFIITMILSYGVVSFF